VGLPALWLSRLAGREFLRRGKREPSPSADLPELREGVVADRGNPKGEMMQPGYQPKGDAKLTGPR